MKQTDFVVTLFEGKENPENLTVAAVVALNALKQGHSATLILVVKAGALGQPAAATGGGIGAPFPGGGGTGWWKKYPGSSSRVRAPAAARPPPVPVKASSKGRNWL